MIPLLAIIPVTSRLELMIIHPSTWHISYISSYSWVYIPWHPYELSLFLMLQSHREMSPASITSERPRLAAPSRHPPISVGYNVKYLYYAGFRKKGGDPQIIHFSRKHGKYMEHLRNIWKIYHNLLEICRFPGRGGTPNWMVYEGKSSLNGWFTSSPMYGNPRM